VSAIQAELNALNLPHWCIGEVVSADAGQRVRISG